MAKRELTLELREFMSALQSAEEEISVLVGRVRCRKRPVKETPFETIYEVVCIPQTDKAMIAKISCTRERENHKEYCLVDIYRYDEDTGWEFLEEFGV